MSRTRPGSLSHEGAGTAYSNVRGKPVVSKNRSGTVKEFREVCSPWPSICLASQIPDLDHPRARSSETSFSTTSSPQENRGRNQEAIASDFGVGGSASGGSLAGVFGGFGLPSPSAKRVLSPFEDLGSTEEEADFLALVGWHPELNDPIGPPPTGEGTDTHYPATGIMPSTEFDPYSSNPGKDAGPLIAGHPLFDAAPTVDVPEPFTLSLFVAGMIGAAATRRRKFRSDRSSSAT